MGARSAREIEREIEVLRTDTDDVLAELETRLREAMNVRTQAERHPLVAGSVGLALFGGLGLFTYTLLGRVIHKPAPGEGLRQSLQNLRKPLSGMARSEGGREVGMGEGLIKKVLWTFLATVLVTLASFAARKLSTTIWTKTMEERPPK